MLVTCAQCQSRFNLIDDLVKPGGSKVRCSRCKHVFAVFPSPPATDMSGESPWSAGVVPQPQSDAPPEKPEAIASEPERPEPRLTDVPDTENLFEDFEDMDLSVLEKSDSPAEPSRPEAAGIDDLDLGLSFEEEKEKTGEGWESEEFDLSEIEKLVEESRTRESDREKIEIEDLELSLDLEEQEVKEESSEETVHLDISELEEAGSEAESGESPKDAFDFGDLELNLDLEEEKEESPEETVRLDISELEEAGSEAESGESPKDAFDFGDLELNLDLEAEKEESPEETVLLDISELEEAGPKAESGESPKDAFDFGDLDLKMDLEEEESPGETASLDISEPEEARPEADSGESPKYDFDFGDLDLKMDLEEEKAESSKETVHLDISGLGEGGDKGAEKKIPEIEDLDLLVDFDREEGGLKLDDLSDIEKMVEESAGRQPAKGESTFKEDLELEMNLDLEPEIKEDEKSVLDVEEIDRLDLSDIGILDLELPSHEAEPEPQASRMAGLEKTDAVFQEASMATALYGGATAPSTAGATGAGETDKKADFPEQDRMPAGQAASGGDGTFRLKDFGDEAALEEGEAGPGTMASDAKKKGAVRRSKRISAPVMALLIITLLACAGYGGFILVDRMGIEIPFVGRYIDQYLGPKVEDPGNLRIEAFDITSQFVDNQAAGKLFVITGRLKNEYPEPRGFINVTAKLYTKGKVAAKTETVFGGNVLSDTELANLDLEAVKKRLSSRVGDNRSNVRIPEGGVIPFMVVFSNLPEDMEEFSLEVAGSMPASKT